MADSVLGLKVGDYILWRGPDSDSAEKLPPMIGKVVRIHKNKLGKEVKEKLGVPISGEPYAVIQLENVFPVAVFPGYLIPGFPSCS